MNTFPADINGKENEEQGREKIFSRHDHLFLKRERFASPLLSLRKRERRNRQIK